jgi:hypothetical protein
MVATPRVAANGLLDHPASRDGFRSWEALSAGGLPDYLRAAGIVRTERISTSRSPGRNRVHRVCRNGEAHPSWFVKQFGFGDHDGAAFEREREATTSLNMTLILSPVLVDDTWRVLVFPAFGESLYEAMCSGAAISPEIGSTLRRDLRELQADPTDTALRDLPPILRSLSGGFSGVGLSTAQRRLVTTLRHDPVAQRATERALSAWRAGVSQGVLCHGDLKLEHVLVAKSGGECRCVDWEFARLGPAEWDFAGLLQSVLANVVLDLVAWSPDIRRLLVESLADVGIESPDFAALVALRLWQTAIEWETGRVQLSEKSGSLCQLGVNLARDPGQLGRLLGSAG